MDLTAQVLLQIAAVETRAADLSSTVTTTNISQALAFSTGTGANQAQVIWSDSRTIADLSDDLIDLRSLSDHRGTVTLTAVKLIYVRNTGTVPVNWIGNGDWATGPQKLPNASNYEIPPGGFWVATNPSADGWIVSGFFQAAEPQVRLMTLVNGSDTTAATYDILLIGEGSIA